MEYETCVIRGSTPTLPIEFANSTHAKEKGWSVPICHGSFHGGVLREYYLVLVSDPVTCKKCKSIISEANKLKRAARRERMAELRVELSKLCNEDVLDRYIAIRQNMLHDSADELVTWNVLHDRLQDCGFFSK